MNQYIKISLSLAIVSLLLTILSIASDNISAPNEKISQQHKDIPLLSEQDAINSALQTSNKLKFLNTNIEIANYRYKSVKWIMNPELRIGEETEDGLKKINDPSDLPYNFNEIKAGLRFRFPELGEIREEKQQALVKLTERRIEEIQYRHRIVARTRKNYAKVLMYDNLVNLAAQRVAKEDERIKIIEQMVDLGNRSVVYYSKAKMWHAESQNNYSRTVQNQVLARRLLSKRTGAPENSLLLVYELPEVTQDLDTLISLAFQHRPEITLVQHRIELAIRQENMEKLKLVPWVNFAEYSYHKQSDGDAWKEFSAGISIPLLYWNLDNIKATKLAVKQNQGKYNAIQESIAEEVRSTYIIYKDLYLEWQNFKNHADDLILNVKDVVEQAKQHETLLPDEVLEMELTIIETQEILSKKRRDVTYALIDLFFAIGIENHDMLN